MDINGDVNIVLFDNSTLNFKKGVNITNGSSLNLWVRDGGLGKVTATSSAKNLAAISVNDGSTLSLNGPSVTATTSTNDAAGIGGDSGKSAGKIFIYRGTIETTSKKNAAGIGGGMGGSGGNIHIGGGTITATSKGEDGAGIGGGSGKAFNSIKIDNSIVSATGAYGAGISGGGGQLGKQDPSHVNGGTISIKDSSVIATSTFGGAGIGGGIFGRADSIDISGGMVIASGGAMFGAEDMPAVATAIVQDIMRQINYEKDLFHVIENIDEYGATGVVGGVFATVVGTMVSEIFKGIQKIFGESTPSIICYTGAGIGGGYRSAGGKITIRDNAVVKLSGVVGTDDEGNNIEVTKIKNEDGISYTFTMPYSNVRVKGVVAQNHKIIIEETLAGKIVTSDDEALLDTVVSVIVRDRNLHDITVLDNKNERVELKELATNTYSFVMPDSDVYIYGDIFGSDPYKIIIGEGAPKTDFANLSHLEYIVKLEDPESQYLLMDVTHYEEGSVPEADKNLIAGMASDLGAGAGNWFDISMYICNSEDDSRVGPLPKPEKPVELKAEIPEDFRKERRTFYLIGIKDGKAFCYGETTGTEFTWETDTFGTYLIAYKDAGQSSGTVTPASGRSGAASPANVTKVTGGNTVTTATSAKTGDKTHLPAFIAIAAAGAAGLVGAFVARRRKKD